MEFPHVLKHLLNLVRYNLHPTAPANALAIKVFPVPGGPVKQNASRNLGANLKATGQPQMGKTGFFEARFCYC